MENLFSLDLQQIFIPSGSILEIVLRGTLMYFALLLLLRFVLRREPGKIGLADMLLVVILADASQNAMAGGYKSWTEGALLVCTLVFWNYALDWLAFRYPFMQRLLEPAPLMLVKNGQMLRRNMRQEMITEEELRSQLRQNGIDDLSNVKEARIESDGNISVVGFDH